MEMGEVAPAAKDGTSDVMTLVGTFQGAVGAAGTSTLEGRNKSIRGFMSRV